MAINFKADGLKKEGVGWKEGHLLIWCALRSAELQMETAAENGDLSKQGEQLFKML